MKIASKAATEQAISMPLTILGDSLKFKTM